MCLVGVETGAGLMSISDNACDQSPMESKYLIIFLDFLGYRDRLSDDPSLNSGFLEKMKELAE